MPTCDAAAKSLRCLAGILLLSLTVTAPRAEDLTDRPLETLLDAEVTSASTFARQVTEAASAVSVLTSEDIRVLGLRTLGEVLDQMRGLHISHSTEYVFLGARGIGGPLSLAGRVLLLVDGVPAIDNLYDQIYLGHDGVIDVALIDRIEYAPGNGSAMYGNNAFLGVINVVTKRGRDLAGLQISAARGDWGDRAFRMSAGSRLPGGAEWLLSFSTHHNSGIPSDEIGDLFSHSYGDDGRVFLKARWQGFSVEAWSAKRQLDTVVQPSFSMSHSDANQLVSLGHDGRPAEGWRSTVRLQAGRYAYDADIYDASYPTHYQQTSTGAWWSAEGQLAYDGFADHRAVVGMRLRRDPLLNEWATQDGAVYTADTNRHSLAFSVEDEYTVTPELRVVGGARLDRPDYAAAAWSPLAAVVWEPAPRWTLKLSEGRATRYASPHEEFTDTTGVAADERVTTGEFVTEYRLDTLRLLGSLYRYRVDELLRDPTVQFPADYPGTRGHGIELEAEWQWHGFRLRGSQAWQGAKASDGGRLAFSPRSVSKLMASVPLHGEALRASLSLRRTGDFVDDQHEPVPARTLLDLTFASQQVVAGLDVRLGVRNLLQAREQALDSEYFYDPPTGRRQRTAWIEFTGTFR